MKKSRLLKLSMMLSLGFSIESISAQEGIAPPPPLLEQPAPQGVNVPAPAAEQSEGQPAAQTEQMQASQEEYYYTGEVYKDPGQKIDWIPDWIVPDFFKPEDKIWGIKRWSRYDYEMRANAPIGSRQKTWKGKVWPVRPRPTGVKPHLVHRFHAAHYWPTPFMEQDRETMQKMMEMHISNGWREATTFYAHHFDPVTNELNHSGEEQVRWILQSAPAQRKQFFVQTSATAGVNELRVTQLQQVAIRLSGNTDIPAISLRNASPPGRKASEIDTILKSIPTYMPPATIPYSGGAGPSYGSAE